MPPQKSLIPKPRGPIFMVRYWFGPGDTIYVETIDSDADILPGLKHLGFCC